MVASYTDTGNNLACRVDVEGNVWEVRHSGVEYHLFKNERYETTMSTKTNIMVLFNFVFRNEA